MRFPTRCRPTRYHTHHNHHQGSMRLTTPHCQQLFHTHVLHHQHNNAASHAKDMNRKMFQSERVEKHAVSSRPGHRRSQCLTIIRTLPVPSASRRTRSSHQAQCWKTQLEEGSIPSWWRSTRFKQAGPPLEPVLDDFPHSTRSSHIIPKCKFHIIIKEFVSHRCHHHKRSLFHIVAIIIKEFVSHV